MVYIWSNQSVCILSIIMYCTLISGVEGFQTTTTECQPCSRDDHNCRWTDCRLPIGREVNITCIVYVRDADECNPYLYPLSIHRIDAIGPGDGGRNVPGFVRLEHLERGCSLQLTFVTTAESNNVVLQCAVRKLTTFRFSQAHVVGIRHSGVVIHRQNFV
jgi:hypothetical protein